MAQSFDAHAQEEHGAERQCWHEPGWSWKLDGRAREQGGHKIATAHMGERESDGKRNDCDGRKTKGNGVNPALGRPIYRGVHRIYPLQFLPPYNAPQRLYSEKFARRLQWNFCQQLRPKL
jgi:hypothetical protein